MGCSLPRTILATGLPSSSCSGVVSLRKHAELSPCGRPKSLVSRLVRGRALAQFVESRFESGSKFLSRASAPVVQEDDHRTVSCHVVWNGDDIKAVPSEGFENGRHFVFKHRHVARDRGVFLRPDKCGPGCSVPCGR